MGKQRCLPIILVAFCLRVGSIGLAQQAKPVLPAETILQAPRFDDFEPDLSPDGKWLAYTLRDPVRTRLDQNSNGFFSDTGAPTSVAGTDVWITNIATGKSENVTLGKGSNWGVSWSPDNKLLAFYSDRDGHARVWLYDASNKSIRRLSKSIVRVLDPWQVPRWSPDSTMIATKVVAQNSGDAVADATASERASEVTASDQTSVAVSVYISSGQSTVGHQTSDPPVLVRDEYTRAERADIALIDVASQLEHRISGEFSPVWYSWSPDGSQLAFANMKGLYRGEVYRELFDLILATPEGGTRVIDADILRYFHDFSASWSPAGTSLAYVVAGAEGDGECFIVPTSGGRRRKATNDSHPPFSPLHQRPLWSSTGDSLYFVTATYSLWTISARDGHAREVARIPGQRIYAIIRSSNGDRLSSRDGERSVLVSTIDDTTRESGFYRIDLVTGAWTKLRSENKSYDLNRILSSNDGQNIVYAAEDIARPPDYFISNSEFTESKQLTSINSSLSQYPMGEGRLIRWRSDDGDIVQGALLLPSDYDQGKRYPLIVQVYPGVFSPCVTQFGLCGENFFPNKQLFATRGYAVFMPDIRLTGKTMMADLGKIVLSGINKTIDMGIADPGRIGLMGTSWGGYSTLALIVQTSRFKAAAMVSGFGDLLGFYGEMDESGSSLGVGILDHGNGQFRMPGTPWEFPGVYVANSPIFYLDRVETPLLIIHGNKDTNVAPFLADQVFVGLRRLGKRATYLKYAEENHGIQNYENQLDCFNRIAEWFSHYLVGQNMPGDGRLEDRSPQTVP
ncbi:MAG: S9 family peptidase [Acidobacteria bacterium]|nr:S9 family peptidase [Acidobacteriota bacterium]